MPNIEELIKDALSDQEIEIMKSTEELGYFPLAIGLFKGKLGWVSWIVMISQGIMFVTGAWCAWRFFGATDTLIALKWGMSASVLLLMAAQMKLSFMPQMQSDRVLRELKRIELLILHRAGQ